MSTGTVAHPGGLGRLVHELAHLDLVERELGGTGVDPADLEEVVDHALEAAKLRRQEVDGPTAATGEIVTVRLENPERRDQGGER
jgi:hypothetical protein